MIHLVQTQQATTMETNNETFEVELFIHDNEYRISGFMVCCSDMSEYGYPLLGTQTVTLNMPTRDAVEAEIEMLDKKEAAIIKQRGIELLAISDRKSQLICLDNLHKPDDILSTLNTEENE